ncbi:hypothetical protein PGT21_031702 [Puccinia graminis f. sp. tritici]|uniref:Uncharacterized protein n=1 Tax=Puccinia graminis f. sp. tritici TaxID=56615 RepID=A0A5B0M6W9_PUCGR|nr:hypothetical protein PGT21_031702 [Puccinia graminis f. sp. tritici]KAA1086317.1 hypothetical protein PGTUg99_010517 [Puccinia graminis f. sp. tritici]KAA1106723.1 hypothetical protein PGTUg99_014461 [Puccinia graminis f. sp. tritici]
MELSSSIVLPPQTVHNSQPSDSGHLPPSQQHILHQQYPSSSRGTNETGEEDTKFPISNASHVPLYEQSYMHLSVPSGSPQTANCFSHSSENNMNSPSVTKQQSPPLSQKSTPTPPPTSSPSSPCQSAPSNLIDLNSIVSYSQLLQRKDEVILALKYRSGDHLATQALELLRAGRERVKRITAAGRAATGKPPVKHIQEQYLAVFSRFSEYCTSQNIPTWPIEPVRVAIWVLAMQEKSPPTPATLRQYITRLEFTCTVTAGLFEPEFGASSPLKGSALLRELVNRDLPGQPPARQPRSPSSSKPIPKRGSSLSTCDPAEHSLTPTNKKWSRFEGVPGEFERYDHYLSPFSPSVAYQATPLIPHPNNSEMWAAHSGHQAERYSNEVLHHCHPHSAHPVSQHYHPESNHHLEHHQHSSVNGRPRSHEVVGNPVQLHSSHRSLPPYQRGYSHEYINPHGNPSFPSHHPIIPPNGDGRYIPDPAPNQWS